MNTTVPTSSKLFKTAASAGKIMMLVFGFLLVFGNDVHAQATPGSPGATGITPVVTSTTATISWTPDPIQTGTTAATLQSIFVFQGSTATPPPITAGALNATAYSTNGSADGLFDVINDSQVNGPGGPSGWYCVSSADGISQSSEVITGLSPNTAYTVMVVTYNTTFSSGTKFNYLATAASGNPVTFTTAALSLSNLVPSAGALSPAFASTTLNYTLTESAGTSTINLTPTVTDPSSSVTVNNVTATSGSPSAVSLSAGANLIPVTVTSADLSSSTTYNVNIGVGNSVATLSALSISQGGPLSFSPTTFSYTANPVHNQPGTIAITPTVTDPTASSVTITDQNGAITPVTINPGTGVGTPANNINLNAGSNAITITVIAQDGVTTDTYTINITRQSNVATLQALVLTAGASSPPLSPTFTAGAGTSNGTLSYTANVPAGTTGITVTPTVTDATSVVTLGAGGPVIASGSPSTTISLSPGVNPAFTVVVTSQDGTVVDTYSIVVTVQSNIATLASETFSIGATPVTLNTPVVPGTLTGYTASVPAGTTSITVTPNATDPTSVITINGNAATTGVGATVSGLVLGPNNINTVVKSQDGTVTNTYTVVVTVLSNNSLLSGLTTTPSTTLAPTFASGTMAYTANLPYGTPSITVTPTTADGQGTYTVTIASVTGSSTNIGVASAPITLATGDNNISILVTSQDTHSTNTYTLDAKVAQPSTIATLSNLLLSNTTTTANIPFDQGLYTPATTAYTTTVLYNVTSVTVAPTTTDPNATVTVNGLPASTPVTLTNIGANVINILVTAQDGQTTVPYSITVNLPAVSTDATLSNLVSSAGAFNENGGVFSPAITTYSQSVSNATTSVTLTPTVNSPFATVTVNGVSATNPVALVVGANIIPVVVTAQDGVTTITYTVTVTRAGSAVNTLSAMVLNSGAISPAFAPGTTSYTQTVPNGTTTVTVTPVVTDPTATVTVAVNGGTATTVASGATSGNLALNVGANTITVVVTPQNLTPINTYTITVTRAASSVSTLSGITLAGGAFAVSPTFNSGTLLYTASATSGTTTITIRSTATAGTIAGITVNGTAETSGVTSPTSFPISATGPTTFTIIVTAQDGVTKTTYTVYVTTLAPGSSERISTLTVTTTPATTLNPTFNGSTSTEYTASVANTTASATFNFTLSTASTTTSGTWSLNGGATTPITISPTTGVATAFTINFTAGITNTINIAITHTGTGAGASVYTFTLIPQSTSSSLSNLVLSAGAFTPVFAFGTLTGYTLTVPGATATTTVTAATTDGTGTIAVNGGTAFGSSGTSQSVNLTAGATTAINTVVTPQSGTASTYVVNVTRQSNTATLQALTVQNVSQGGTVNIGTFASGTTAYTATVTGAVQTITVTPTVTALSNATVQVNGTTVASGTASANITLNPGANVITTAVTSQDGSVLKVYTITITQQSNVASLANLVLTGATLNPTFSGTNTSYTASVSSGTTSVTVTPTSNLGGTITVALNGGTAAGVTSGSAKSVTGLLNGANTIAIVVTSTDLTQTKTYNIVVTRAETMSYSPSSFTVFTGNTMTPTNAPTVTGASTPTGLPLTYTAPSLPGGLTINATTGVISGTPTTVAGATPYVITANYAGGITATATLTITVSAPTLSYTGSSFTYFNGSTIANLTPSSNVTGSASGGYTVSPALPAGIALNATTGVISGTPTSTATVNTYTVTATYLNSVTATFGISITVNQPTISYSSSSFTFPATVAITPFSPNQVSGTPSSFTGALPTGMTLNSTTGAIAGTPTTQAGPVQYTITANYQNSVTATFNITITISAPSTINTLSGLTLTNPTGTLSPGFATGTLNYIVDETSTSTTSTSVTPTATDAVNAKITVNGTSVNSGSATTVALTGGTVTPITIIVTAQNGTSSTYTVNVSVGVTSSTNSLSGLTISSGTLNPAFSSTSNAYTDVVPYAVSSVTVTPSNSRGTTIKVGINGPATTTVASGSASGPLALNVGLNTITITVGSSTYQIYVTQSPPSTISQLSNLITTPASTLSPTFTPATTIYSSNVPFAASSITVTPSTSDGTGTYTVNGGSSFAIGTASAPISLSAGANPLTILVTSQDGLNTSSYTLTVNRQSNTATLANLVSSGGAFDQGAFVAGTGTSAYTQTVPAATTFVNVTPTVTDATSTVTVNGTPVTSGSASGNITLAPGNNTITTVVTSQDLSTVDTYTLTVLQQSSTASLSALTTSPPTTLTPPFLTSTTAYAASVPFVTSAMTVTPTSNAGGTITVAVNPGNTAGGTPVAVTSGTASTSLPLAVGPNTITIAVTSTDHSTTTNYTLTVTRTAPSTSSTLVTLTTNPAITFTPPFTGGTNTYSANVLFATSALTFTPTTTDGTGTITVNNGTPVNSGVASQSVPLSVGANIIPVTVNAENGTTNTYTITVNRGPQSTVNTLSALSVSTGSLSPNFASNINSYAVEETTNASITVSLTVTDPTATVKVNNVAVTLTSGSGTSGNVTLTAGANTAITVVVTAQSGATNTYTINVGVTPTQANEELAALTVNNVTQGGTLTLNPGFASGSLTYTSVVLFSTASVTVTPTSVTPTFGTNTIKVNGTTVASGGTSGSISLTSGAITTITVAVTNNDVGTATYTILVNRPAVSTDATLSALTTTPATTFIPTFVPATNTYTVNATGATTAITLTPITNSGFGTISVNSGTAFNSGGTSQSVPLNAVGVNTPISVVVTAQDNSTTDTYTLNVTRQSNVGTLQNLTVSSGAFDQGAFVAGTGTSSYTQTVGPGVTSTTLSATVTDPTSTVTINGVAAPLTSGIATSAPITLNPGNTVITTVVTSQDGTVVNTYTVTIKQTSSIGSLFSLVTTPGTTFVPTFASATTAYTINVLNAVSQITVTPTSNAGGTITVTANSATNGVTSGQASVPISLAVGSNTITVTVTSTDFSTVTPYTLTVIRGAPSNVATLATLATTPATTSFTPSFTSGVMSYTATVGAATAGVTVTATTTDGTGTIAVNGGTPFASGGTSQNVPISIGSGNTISVVVLAQDGVTTNTYTVTVTRPAPSTTATLSALTLTAGTLSPVFASGTNSYAITTTATTTTVTPTLTDPTATVTVNGTTVTSGSASGAITLTSGTVTNITVVVTAQDGVTTDTYAIAVGVSSTFPTFTALTVSQGTLSPAFAAATVAYVDYLPFATTSLTVTPTGAGETITVNGTGVASGAASGAINLNVGANTITILTSENFGQTFSNTYEIVANRAASPAITAPASIAAVATTTTGTASTPTSFNVSGANITGNVTITAPTGFEVSATSNGTYASSFNITTAGTPTVPVTLASTPVFVRLAAADAPNTYSGSITVSTTGGLSTVNGGVISTTVTIPSSIVTLIPETITFNPLSPVTYGAGDISPNATTSNPGGQPVTYTITGGTAASIVSNKVHLLGSGTVTVTANQLGDGTHSAAASVSQSLIINQATLTISSPAASNKTYDGGTVATVSGTLVGVVTPDVITLNTTGTFGSANAGVQNVTGFGISGTNAASYILTQPSSVTATISPIGLTVSGLSASSKPYDGTTAASLNGTGALSGLVAADITAGSVTLNGTPTGVFSDANVGTGKTVIVSGYSVSGPSANNYTFTQPAGLTADITAIGLTVSGLTASSKPYDGTTAATLNGTGALSGLVAADITAGSVTLNGTPTAVFSDANVGTGKTVIVSGYSVSGPSANNYTFTQPALTADITAIGLTVSGLTASSKPYDGTTAATLNGTGALSGLVAADITAGSVTLNGTPTAVFSDANVGTGKTVIVSGYSVSGPSANNYTFTQPALTADITAIGLTVSGLSASSKPYDGTTAASLNGTGALSGLVAADITAGSVTLNGTPTGVFSDANVGTGKTVIVSGYSISGPSANNYTFTQPAGLTADITAIGLTVSGLTASSKPYDGTTAATLNGTGALSGLVAADITAGSVTLNGTPTAVFSDANVGTGKTVIVSGYSVSGPSANNYTFTQPALTADITAIGLTVSGLSASSKPYDGTTAATLNGTGALSGLVAADITAGSVTLNGTPTAVFSDANVGTGKTVIVSGYSVSGPSANNYTFTQPALTADITAIGLTVSGLSASSKPYDGTTAASLNGTGALSGLVAADITAGSVTLNGTPTGVFSDANVGTGKTVIVSGYSISGPSANNYTFTQPAGLTADITAIGLTVSGLTASSKPYDGTTAATLNGTGALSGLVAADITAGSVTLNGTPTAVFSDANVGTGKTVIVSGYSVSGPSANNYTFTQPALTADITAIGLTVSGLSASSKPYDGTTAATLSGTGALSGLVAADITAGSVTLNGTPTAVFSDANVGTGKTVIVSGYSVSGPSANNYTFTQPALTADITAIGLTVSGLSASSKPYDGTTAASLNGTGALSGLVAADITAGSVTLNGTPTGVFSDANVGTGKTVIVSGYSISGPSANNYTFTQPAGLTADITAIGLTVSGLTASSKPYDGTTAATLNGTGALSGLVAADITAGSVTLNGTPTAVFSDANVGTGKTVIVSGYSISGPSANNYTFTQPAGLTANITAIGLTVSGLTASSKPYDGTTAATLNGTGALSGLVAADITAGSVTLNGTPTAVFSDANVGTGKTVIVSGYSVSGPSANNYTFTQPALTADITAIGLTVSGLSASSKPYDGTTAATLSGTGALSGLVAADITAGSVTLNGTPTAVFSDANVGTGKTVIVSGYSVSGPSANNYTFTQPAGLTANITAIGLTVSGLTANSKPYDGTTAATLSGTGTLSGLVAADITAGSVTLNGTPTAVFASAAVGINIQVIVTGYSISGPSANNYTFTQPTGLTANITTVSDAALSNLVSSGGALTPAFTSGNFSYTQTVSSAVASISVTPTTHDSHATYVVALNGTTVNPASIALAIGANTITTKVTAQDGVTTQTYTLTVTRLSNNAFLSHISISAGTLVAAGATSYTVSESNATTSVTVTPTTSDPNATVTVSVNGAPATAVLSGTASPGLPLNVGGNNITILVTAQDGITTKTYTITASRTGSSNANLASLSISTGTLTPVFATGTISYAASVGNATTSVTVTPTVADATATVTVALNGGTATVVNSATASLPLSLNVGANTIATKVTAQDGVTSKTYTITVTRAPSNNAYLSHLTLSTGTLSPAFVNTTSSYTASVSNATTGITVTPTTLDPTATVTVAVNGGAATAVASATASGTLALNVGSNTVTTKVTAQDGITTITYTVTVTRAPSSNAFLSHITMSGGTLVAAGTTSFTASVANTTASVTVTPTTSDPTATIKVAVNGGTASTVFSGNASGSLPLNVGVNTINAVVTAQDGVTTQTYVITVTRAQSSNANLASLSISSGTLAPAFAAGTTSYAVSVVNTTTSVTVTPTVADPTASIKVAVNGGTAVAVAPATASGSLSLNLGANTVSIIVTAQDGTIKTYAITVTRVPSSNANLSHITMTGGTLVAAGTTSFTASVANTTTSVTVTPTASDPTATIKVAVNGGTASTVFSGNASGSLPLNIGANTITAVVTAQNGTTTVTYTITVTRAPSSNANLSMIALSTGTLTPIAGTNNYTASVSTATTSVTVTPTTADPTATVKVAVNGGTAVAVASGTPSGSLALNIGANTITVVVTAQDGVTVKTYTLTVTRVSNNAFLSHITMSGGTLVAAGSTSFTASVTNATTSVTVTPTTSDPNATVKVNGASVLSGTASAAIHLNVGGNNTITTIVTAQDGITTQTYIITVTRATGPLMSLYQPIQPEISVTKPTDTVAIENDGVMVHQGVSPNGDGINDFLTIDGISAYPNNRFTIIDRNGSLVYEVKGYDNSSRMFDGHSNINGKLQQPGTYFYSLDYVVNGQTKHKTGFIILKY